jgi:hypothetical protein
MADALNPMQTLAPRIEYEWAPFEVRGSHLCFSDHIKARLSQAACSWWGPAIYKWEGPITSGPNEGKLGVLIGETADLRARIKQYVRGTQRRGNKLWRETFLQLGRIALYTLKLDSLSIGREPIRPDDALASNNMRLFLEQALVMEVLSQRNPAIWVVNARQ